MAVSSYGHSDEAKKRKADTDELVALPSPSADTSKRFPLDQRLRAAGFAIAERPAGREAVWSKGGVEFRQSEALLRIPQEVK